MNNGDSTFSRQRDLGFADGGAAFLYALDYDADSTVDLGVVRGGLGSNGAPGQAYVFTNPNNDAFFQPPQNPLNGHSSIIDWACATKQHIYATTGKGENYVFGFDLGERTPQGNFVMWLQSAFDDGVYNPRPVHVCCHVERAGEQLVLGERYGQQHHADSTRFIHHRYRRQPRRRRPLGTAFNGGDGRHDAPVCQLRQ